MYLQFKESEIQRVELFLWLVSIHSYTFSDEVDPISVQICKSTLSILVGICFDPSISNFEKFSTVRLAIPNISCLYPFSSNSDMRGQFLGQIMMIRKSF